MFASASSRKAAQTPRNREGETSREANSLLKHTFDSALDGMVVFDGVQNEAGETTDLIWHFVNPAAARLLGQSETELRGCLLRETMPSGALNALFDACFEVARTGAAERRTYCPNEGEGCQVIVAPAGRGVSVTFHRADERARAQEALAASNATLKQRNRELQDFAYVASHDLQEPLRKIRAFAGLMQEDYAEAVDEMGRYYLDRMRDGAERMSDLIAALLSLSRLATKARPFEEVDLRKVAEGVCSDLEIRLQETGGTVELGGLPTVVAERMQMRQLLQNLIGNALKFHREGVPPVVRVTAVCEHASLGAQPEARDIIRLVVEDNGIGFDKKYLSRIFTPFQRLHGRGEYEGTGMGLAICRRIVERHQGTIDAKSTPGKGSAFIVCLPAHQPEPAGHDAEASGFMDIK